jgi:cystathionine beta-lyase
VSPSKTFNIPGLGLSSLIINDRKYWQSIKQVFDRLHINAINPFSITAFETAYREGEQWLDELMAYLDETRQQVAALFEEKSSIIKVIKSQATYLLWLDCRAMNLNDNELKLFFVKQAKVGLNPGISFGEAGSGFMRMNIAAPRKIILDACRSIIRVL